jgi:hypothetical protein
MQGVPQDSQSSDVAKVETVSMLLIYGTSASTQGRWKPMSEM